MNENKYSKMLHIYFTIFHFARCVARDIGGSDPERMAAPNVEQYIQDLFENTDIKVDVVSDPKVLGQDYPLLAAVDRVARSKYFLVLSLCFTLDRGACIFVVTA